MRCEGSERGERWPHFYNVKSTRAQFDDDDDDDEEAEPKPLSPRGDRPGRSFCRGDWDRWLLSVENTNGGKRLHAWHVEGRYWKSF